MEVELRAVEGAVAGVDGVFLADAGDSVGKRGGGDVPILDGADVILRHGGQLYLVGQTEERIDLVKELRDADDLVLDLLGSEEDMRVVLSEAADAEHTVQRTGELVAMDKAELAEAQRQLLIGVRLELIDQNAAGAVHGLDGKVLAVDDGGVHIVLIVIPVTGGLPTGCGA